MKCPVCKAEIDSSISVCPECGFDECNQPFINQEEAEAWYKERVIPYQRRYRSRINSLAYLKAKMYQSRRYDDEQRFLKRFSEGVNNKEWMSVPINGEHPNIELVYKNIRGGYYLAVYSGMDGRAAGDSKSVLTIDVSKVIDIMYSNPHLLGIVFDPNKDPYCLSRKSISSITDKKDPRLQVKDWGEGIPSYTKEDLMSEEELLDFGMEAFERHYLKDNGYSIIDEYKGVVGFPNFVLKKDEQIYLTKVVTTIAPNRNTLSEKDKAFYLEHCKKFNAKCLYVVVAFNSIDSERSAEGLALCGDGYNVSIELVQELR